jgi:hypothetical protein
VSGDSAGGGLAVSTVIAVRDRHLPMCAGIVALSPWADLICSGENIMSRAAADIECTRAGLLEMAGWYMKGADPAPPLASSVFADFAEMPALLCIAGGDEELLDDSIRWCAMPERPESTQHCILLPGCSMFMRSGLAPSPKPMLPSRWLAIGCERTQENQRPNETQAALVLYQRSGCSYNSNWCSGDDLASCFR